jgi:hypothetical protein
MEKLSKFCSPAQPVMVMSTSAIVLARVPVSVDRNPQLNTPWDRRGDITFDRSDTFTPAHNHNKDASQPPLNG